MSDPATTTFPTQSDGIHVQRDEAGSKLYDADGRQVCVLNESALALWELCDGATAPEEMVDAVRIACGLAREEAEADIARTLQALTEAGIVTWTTGDG